MSNRYVNVEITRQTTSITKEAFGFPLLVTTEKAAPYKEYKSLAELTVDFAAETEMNKMAARVFGQKKKPAKVATFGQVYVAETNTPAELSTALSELVKTHGDFFYLLCTDQTDGVITEISNWNKTQTRLYFASTSNPTLHVTLKDNENTILLVHPKPETYPAAAWVGDAAPRDVGSYTYTFKELKGIEPANYTDEELDAIEVGASSYIRVGGRNITSKGVTTSGEYIDIVQGQYYLHSEITNGIFEMLATTDKVVFSNGGINSTVAVLETKLKEAAVAGVIAKDDNEQPLYEVVAPELAAIPRDSKIKRTLPNVNWDATVEGAIENVDIRGVLKI